MDGAIPAFNADSMRQLTARFNLSSGAGSAHSLQSGLFEQLLSAPPPNMDRQSSSYNASDANYSIDPLAERERDSQASSVRQRSDRDERQDVQSDDDEPSEPSAEVAQATALPVLPIAAPLIAGEDTSADIPEVNPTVDGAAEDAGSKSSDVDTGEPGLDESSPKSPTMKSEAATSLSQAAVESGPAEIDPLGSSDQVQAVASDDTASDFPTNTASSQAEAQVQTAQTLPATGTDDAATHAIALDPSSSTAEEEPRPEELGDERLRHPRTEASDEKSAVATGESRQVGEQAEAPSTDGDRSRDNRREKWFQRETGDSSSARGESNAASKTPAIQAAVAADEIYAGVANAHSGSMAEGSVNSSLAAENTVAQTLPDALTAQVQPPTVNAATMAADRRLSALENAAGGGPGGERQLPQGSTVDGTEGSQRQSSAQRADVKSGVQDAQRPDVLTQAERVRLVQRVSRSFARLGPMGGEISLKLHPPQLGALNVQVRMEGRSMTAKLTTESGAARDAIMESLPVLRKRLAEQGFEISSFQVEVADTQSDVSSGSDNSRSGSDLTGGGDNRERAGQGTDYRRLAAQQRYPSDRYDVSPSSVVSSGGAAWELPRGVDVQA